MNHDISNGQKYLPKKTFTLRFNSIIQLNFISFNSYKNSRKIPIEKLTFRVRYLQFYKTEPFSRYSCIIPTIQEYLQNVDFPYFLSKFLQQFQNSKNFKLSRASPKSYFHNQFAIIVNEITYRKRTFYLRNFMSLFSFLFCLYKPFILL